MSHPPAPEQWLEGSGCGRASSASSTTARWSSLSARPVPGYFVAPTAIANYVCDQYRVEVVGRIDAIAEQLYAITTERRLTHPAIVAISEAARTQVFGKLPGADDQPPHADSGA
jgi:LysR family transcriptional activator of nhaA